MQRFRLLDLYSRKIDNTSSPELAGVRSTLAFSWSLIERVVQRWDLLCCGKTVLGVRIAPAVPVCMRAPVGSIPIATTPTSDSIRRNRPSSQPKSRVVSKLPARTGVCRSEPSTTRFYVLMMRLYAGKPILTYCFDRRRSAERAACCPSDTVRDASPRDRDVSRFLPK